MPSWREGLILTRKMSLDRAQFISLLLKSAYELRHSVCPDRVASSGVSDLTRCLYVCSLRAYSRMAHAYHISIDTLQTRTLSYDTHVHTTHSPLFLSCLPLTGDSVHKMIDRYSQFLALRRLLRAGANAALCDSLGRSPLHWAVQGEATESLAILLRVPAVTAQLNIGDGAGVSHPGFGRRLSVYVFYQSTAGINAPPCASPFS